MSQVFTAVSELTVYRGMGTPVSVGLSTALKEIAVASVERTNGRANDLEQTDAGDVSLTGSASPITLT